ncbi:MarC family protein [Methylobacterium nigriterrae]|uniref:MarC family protein n=1 Tax=Methylobacterium nigriterrae TaxID=3127512 RepID=UPI003013FDBA
MGFDFAFATKVFAALFAIMNPIANVPVFLSLTEGASAEAQRRVAVTAAIGTTIGCLIAVLAGRLVLGIFGISVNDFRLAGGLLVLLIALSMLQGSASHAHAATPKEQIEAIDPASVAIYPLTVPLLVGPGTIATLIVFAETAHTQDKISELAAGLSAFLLLLAAALLAAPFIGRHLSQEATAITRRLMGMILAAVAMEMIVTSLRAIFPGLTR